MLSELAESERIPLQCIAWAYGAGLRIRFSDGVAARLTPAESGYVLYEDNTREADSAIIFVNSDLADRILDIAQAARGSDLKSNRH